MLHQCTSHPHKHFIVKSPSAFRWKFHKTFRQLFGRRLLSTLVSLLHMPIDISTPRLCQTMRFIVCDIGVWRVRTVMCVNGLSTHGLTQYKYVPTIIIHYSLRFSVSQTLRRSPGNHRLLSFTLYLASSHLLARQFKLQHCKWTELNECVEPLLCV